MNLLRRRGFTVVELAVVIAVIAILVSVTIVAYNSVQADSRNQRRKADIAVLTAELDKYYTKNGEYPSGCSNYVTGSGTSCDISGNLTGYGTSRIYTDTTLSSMRAFLPGLGDKFGDPRGVSGTPFSKANGATNRYVYRGGYNMVGAAATESTPFGTASTEINCGTGGTFGYVTPSGSGKVTSYMIAYYGENEAKWYIHQGKFGEQIVRNDTDAKLKGSTFGNCVFVP